MKKRNQVLLSLAIVALATLPTQARETPMQNPNMHQHQQEMMKMMSEYENKMKAELKSMDSLKGEEKTNKMAEILNKMFAHQMKMHANMKMMHQAMMGAKEKTNAPTKEHAH
jgi:hypothetical protein